MRESEMAELDPRAIKSAVNGTPNLPAISFTLSMLALASTVVAVWATLWTGAAGAATGAAFFLVSTIGFFAATGTLWDAKT